MRIWTSVILICTCTLRVYTQNIVPNPSFELFSNCPKVPGEITKCMFWENVNNSTCEYFNSCDIDEVVGVPVNIGGYSFQYAHTGNAYAGILASQILFGTIREYLYVKLTDSLKMNESYYFSFYISRSNASKYYVSTMGVYFSSKDTFSSSGYLLTVEPIIESNFPLQDTLNWMKISGSLTAKGGEQYLVIGNFKDDSHCGLVNTNIGIGDDAYYYIDDVCVSTSATECGVGVGIEDVKYSTPINVFPNPANEFVNINYRVHSALRYELYNSMGQLVDKRTLNTSGTDAIDVQHLSNGIYFLNVYSKGDVVSRNKIVVQH